MYRLLLLALIGAMTPTHLMAQGGEASFADQCPTWAANLRSGGAPALEALTRGRLSDCTGTGEKALSDAVLSARDSTATGFLWELTREAASVRHPLMLDAASRIAADRSATERARVMAVLILQGLHGGSLSIDLFGGAQGERTIARTELFTATYPASGCALGMPFSDGESAIPNTLPADAPSRTAAVLADIQRDPGGSSSLRGLAACVLRAIRSDESVGPAVDLRDLVVTYVCDNTFRINNPLPVQLRFTYTVVGTDEEDELWVPAQHEYDFDTEQAGPLQLSYNGRVIRTVENGKRVCP